jgi:hypothetical protein
MGNVIRENLTMFPTLPNQIIEAEDKEIYSQKGWIRLDF